MKKLTESLTRMCEVEKLIYDAKGELSPMTEHLLEVAKTDLINSVEGVAFAYKRRQAELEYLKAAFKNAVATHKAALEKFKYILTKAAKGSPKQLKTPIASISVTTKKTMSVAILDFDEVCEYHSEAVNIFTEDNKRTITLKKTMLKEIFQKKRGAVNGFDIIERETEFPNVRIKGWNADLAIGHSAE